MLTRCLPAALLAIALLPASAAAESIPLSIHSLDGGAAALLSSTSSIGSPMIPCEVMPPAGNAAVPMSATDLTARGSYLMQPQCLEESVRARGRPARPEDNDLSLQSGTRAGSRGPAGEFGHGVGLMRNLLRIGALHPLEASTGGGLSFVQSAGLARSAVFVGGLATVGADGSTNGAVLFFVGIAGASNALRARFGLGDDEGSFLVRISADDPIATPEPASMLLIGTGLAGLAATRRRRRASKETT